MSIVAEIPGFLQIFSDGSIKRLPLPTIAASPDFSNGYKSKDVVIDATKRITARIFVPDTRDQLHPLPVIVYFHGSAFCVGTTKWPGFHNYLGGLCAKSQVLIVSVDYRLAPEHKLPAAYEDSYASLEWLARNSSVEPWLERADLSRVFLSGESAGANIVHHVMLRVTRRGIEGMDIKGLLIIHPLFGGEERLESELVDGAQEWVVRVDLLWQLSLPEGANRDHPACNFEKDVVDAECWQQFPAVLVLIAGLDVLKERGIMYAEFLNAKGLEVEMATAEGQGHGFHVFDAESQATDLLQRQLADFMKQRWCFTVLLLCNKLGGCLPVMNKRGYAIRLDVQPLRTILSSFFF